MAFMAKTAFLLVLAITLGSVGCSAENLEESVNAPGYYAPAPDAIDVPDFSWRTFPSGETDMSHLPWVQPKAPSGPIVLPAKSSIGAQYEGVMLPKPVLPFAAEDVTSINGYGQSGVSLLASTPYPDLTGSLAPPIFLEQYETATYVDDDKVASSKTDSKADKTGNAKTPTYIPARILNEAMDQANKVHLSPITVSATISDATKKVKTAAETIALLKKQIGSVRNLISPNAVRDMIQTATMSGVKRYLSTAGMKSTVSYDAVNDHPPLGIKVWTPADSNERSAAYKTILDETPSSLTRSLDAASDVNDVAKMSHGDVLDFMEDDTMKSSASGVSLLPASILK